MTEFISDPSQLNRTSITTKCYGKDGKECVYQRAILISVTSDGHSSYKALP